MKIEVITRLDIRCRNYHYKGTDWILAYAPECDQYVAINFKYIEQSENGALADGAHSTSPSRQI